MNRYVPGRHVGLPQARKRNATILWFGYTIAIVVAVREVGTAYGRDAGWGAFVVGMGIPLLYTALIKRAVNRYNAAAAAGLEALRRDQVPQAIRELTTLREHIRWPRGLRNLTSYNLGLALMRQGELDEAAAALADADRSGGADNIDPALASTLALVHGLRGDVALATTWLTEARCRYVGRTPAAPFPMLITEAVIELRSGDHAGVAQRFERDWVAIENAMKGEIVRPLRVLRAFAVAMSTDARDAGVVEKLVAPMRPVRVADFAYLGIAWPEMDQFLRSHLPG